jgi:citrate synthase
MSDKTAKLIIDGIEYELPTMEGSEGEKAINISKLRASSGYITYDPGLGNTGACKSDITFINGEEGILKHRGYVLKDLTDHASFAEVAYLLYFGNFPNGTQRKELADNVRKNSKLSKPVIDVISAFPQDSHPMGMISAAFSTLTSVYPQFLKPQLTEQEKTELFPILLGQVKTICAYAYRHGQGLKFIEPSENLNYANDFIYMMKGEEPEEDVAKALDVLLILHADHEQNCSASTVRVVGSSQSNIFSSLTAGVTALWGPLHGGANQAVLEMLEAIDKDGGGYEKFLAKAKDKEDPFKLMGFGHRVYKNFDPRARIIKKYCDDLLEKLKIQDPLLDIAKGLETTALSDEYFAQRKLYPNVDFYSGIIYKALGIPTNLFTVMFALGRTPGWTAQWKELTEDGDQKITRPRQIFTGKTNEKF